MFSSISSIAYSIKALMINFFLFTTTQNHDLKLSSFYFFRRHLNLWRTITIVFFVIYKIFLCIVWCDSNFFFIIKRCNWLNKNVFSIRSTIILQSIKNENNSCELNVKLIVFEWFIKNFSLSAEFRWSAWMFFTILLQRMFSSFILTLFNSIVLKNFWIIR